MKSVTLTVSQIERLTAESVKISFEIPQKDRFSFDFFAGQFVALQQEINGEQVRRAYSICSSPYEPLLSVGIKQIPGGVSLPLPANSSRRVTNWRSFLQRGSLPIFLRSPQRTWGFLPQGVVLPLC